MMNNRSCKRCLVKTLDRRERHFNSRSTTIFYSATQKYLENKIKYELRNVASLGISKCYQRHRQSLDIKLLHSS